jgi:histidyl-tRNA synthetase
MERLLALLQESGTDLPDSSPNLYLVLVGEQAMLRGLVFADELRDALPGLRVQCNCGGGSFKSQFKRADRSGAEYALVLGDEEVERQTVTLKPLRTSADQEALQQRDVAARLRALLESTRC